jgi:hypothetical protein
LQGATVQAPFTQKLNHTTSTANNSTKDKIPVVQLIAQKDDFVNDPRKRIDQLRQENANLSCLLEQSLKQQEANYSQPTSLAIPILSINEMVEQLKGHKFQCETNLRFYNIGNSCYLNAGLQCLFHLPLF